MGAGGTFPTNITQTVTLYNTTGLIEKDKGIYFCPFINKPIPSAPPVRVRDAWLGKLNNATNTTSDLPYYEITISQWSPQDRSLVIKGSVDDFRLVTEEGKCFNYLVLKRNVVADNEEEEVYLSTVSYNGFFITGVQQAGIGSVRLELTPDDFTNVFYLHNNKFTRSYDGELRQPIDVFNEKLKNCYIKRQHYNRVKYDAGDLVQDNLPIFSQIEEGFKYKRQFRDYKEYLNYDDPVTPEEKEAYENAFNWASLTSALKTKALKLSTAFIHIILNTVKIGMHGNSTTKGYYNKLPNVHMSDNLIKICMPIYNELDFLKKFKTEIESCFNNILFRGCYRDYPPHSDPVLHEVNVSNVYYDYRTINMFLRERSVVTEYVISAYVTKESSLIKYMEFSDSSITMKINIDSPTADADYIVKDGWLNFMMFPDLARVFYQEPKQTQFIESAINGGTYYQVIDSTGVFSYVTNVSTEYTFIGLIMCVEPDESIEFNLWLADEVHKDPKTEYYDTVLTFNPYSFYSVSYLGRIEVPFNKQNYYENDSITCQITVNLSENLKYSFIPTYEINGLKQKMYSESIEQTFANQLTIVNSQLASYLIANNSQMRNQYAVNELNHEYGLITTGVSGIGNTIGGGIKTAMLGMGGGVGVAGGVSQTVTSLVNEGINWGKDTREIEMNQKAKLADMGNLPSNLKQVGTDITIDLSLNELGLYLNHYTIDEVSYNSICKYLERFGYMVNIYDKLNVNTRVGWDYVQMISFDFDANIMTEQEESIRQIFENGVTLLHDHSVMTSGHNYEVILDE